MNKVYVRVIHLRRASPNQRWEVIPNEMMVTAWEAKRIIANAQKHWHPNEYQIVTTAGLFS